MKKHTILALALLTMGLVSCSKKEEVNHGDVEAKAQEYLQQILEAHNDADNVTEGIVTADFLEWKNTLTDAEKDKVAALEAKIEAQMATVVEQEMLEEPDESGAFTNIPVEGQ